MPEKSKHDDQFRNDISSHDEQGTAHARATKAPSPTAAAKLPPATPLTEAPEVGEAGDRLCVPEAALWEAEEERALAALAPAEADDEVEVDKVEEDPEAEVVVAVPVLVSFADSLVSVAVAEALPVFVLVMPVEPCLPEPPVTENMGE